MAWAVKPEDFGPCFTPACGRAPCTSKPVLQLTDEERSDLETQLEEIPRRPSIDHPLDHLDDNPEELHAFIELEGVLVFSKQECVIFIHAVVVRKDQRRRGKVVASRMMLTVRHDLLRPELPTLLLLAVGRLALQGGVRVLGRRVLPVLRIMPEG